MCIAVWRRMRIIFGARFSRSLSHCIAFLSPKSTFAGRTTVNVLARIVDVILLAERAVGLGA
jgi:hypothetical protein